MYKSLLKRLCRKCNAKITFIFIFSWSHLLIIVEELLNIVGILKIVQSKLFEYKLDLSKKLFKEILKLIHNTKLVNNNKVLL